jgi:hypothetical protein
MHGEIRSGEHAAHGAMQGDLATLHLAGLAPSFSSDRTLAYRARASLIETPSRRMSSFTMGSASNSSREISVRKAISLLLTGTPVFR